MKLEHGSTDALNDEFYSSDLRLSKSKPIKTKHLLFVLKSTC